MRNAITDRWRHVGALGIACSAALVAFGFGQISASAQEKMMKTVADRSAPVASNPQQSLFQENQPYVSAKSASVNASSNTKSKNTINKPCFDFTGSGRTSFASLTRTLGGALTWNIADSSSGNVQTIDYGIVFTDFPTPGYFDGDNVADLNVWRIGDSGNDPAYYFVRPSTNPNTLLPVQFGLSSDLAQREADYDGDGLDDPTVVRDNGTNWIWYYLRSSNGTLGVVSWGAPSTDEPLAGADYNGDGRADISVARYQNGLITYFIADSNTGAFLQAQQWGAKTRDFIIIGDYIGDERADFAVWRGAYNSLGTADAGVWYVKENGGNNVLIRKFGDPPSIANQGYGNKPLCGDYNGDGKDDLAVFAPGREYRWLNSPDYSTSNSVNVGPVNGFPIARIKTFAAE